MEVKSSGMLIDDARREIAVRGVPWGRHVGDGAFAPYKAVKRSAISSEPSDWKA
jgi:hypothetical protein